MLGSVKVVDPPAELLDPQLEGKTRTRILGPSEPVPLPCDKDSLLWSGLEVVKERAHARAIQLRP